MQACGVATVTRVVHRWLRGRGSSSLEATVGGRAGIAWHSQTAYERRARAERALAPKAGLSQGRRRLTGSGLLRESCAPANAQC